jgi:hypothetical protein
MPVDAFAGLLSLFQQYKAVVCPLLGEGPASEQGYTFMKQLLANPAFNSTVDDIVFEAGASRYQSVMDSYTNGANVPFPELKRCWQDTTQPGVWDSPVFSGSYAAVRDANSKASKKVRALLGDPPIDWDNVLSFDDMFPYFDRDGSMAAVALGESLSRGRKALVIIGLRHAQKIPTSPETPTATMLLDIYPSQVAVVLVHGGFYDNPDSTPAVEAKLQSWKTPSLAALKGTWLGALQAPVAPPLMSGGGPGQPPSGPPPSVASLDQLGDYYLYLGPRASLNTIYPQPITYQDLAYWQEYQRRYKILNQGRDLDPFGPIFTYYGRGYDPTHSAPGPPPPNPTPNPQQ